MVKIVKEFIGFDGKPRKWIYDSDTSTIAYEGFGKDFQNMVVVNIPSNKSAQEYINDIEKEKY